MSPMPIYEYACTACGERTEAKQGFSDPPREECLVCGGRLRKLYSPVGIVFKGSGFYSTDARRAPKAASDSSSSSSKEESSATKETKSGADSSKPASKEKSA
jgi:putative FmdB family regulatory protein